MVPDIPFWYRIVDCAKTAALAVSLQVQTFKSSEAGIARLNSLLAVGEVTAIDRCDRSCLLAFHQPIANIRIFLSLAVSIADMPGSSVKTTSNAKGTLIDVTIKRWSFPFLEIVIWIDKCRAARDSRRSVRGGLE